MLALAAALAAEGAPAAPAPVPRVAGYLALDADRIRAWCWSGAWAYPVGDPHDFTRPAGPEGRGFTLLRGTHGRGRGHDGADLGCGRAGDPVRAAANGIVVRVERDGRSGGYGAHVVIAHRLAEGGVAYTVYAHLQRDGLTPSEGDAVGMGQPIGRVGRTGRASTDHLHLEVRRPRDLAERWEHAPVVDPLAFVAARLGPVPEGETASVLLWGAGGDLVARADDPAAPLARTAWWHMLWRSARHDGDVLPDGPRSLREALVQWRVLHADGARERGGAVTWEELALDLGRLRALGVRLPPVPASTAELRAWCERALGVARPSRGSLRRPPDGPSGPTVAQALLALADLASDAAATPPGP